MKLSFYERLTLAVTAAAALVLFSAALIVDARSELHFRIVHAEKSE